MNTATLQAICEMTVRLTELKLREVPHLCIENFAPELFAKLMRETAQAPAELLMRARECAEWHVGDGDECGTHARALMADIDALLGSNDLSSAVPKASAGTKCWAAGERSYRS